MGGIKISAVITTFNEEKNIGRCLQSLQGIADEVIVVDSFSTDRTEEICRQYAVNFFRKKWQDYSRAKNHGNAMAKYDFILSLDADEELSERLQNSIKQLKSDNRYRAYYVSRLTNYCGKWIKHCGWYPDYKIRLWDRDLAHWEGVVHESLKFYKQTATDTLKGDLLHYSFYTISDHIKKANMFSQIAANEVLQKGHKVNSIYHLIINPGYTFIHKYFFQLGFLDGFYGFVICVISAFSNFLKYAKVRDQLGK